MSTIKISQLPDIPGGLNANTSNSLFLGVDIPTGVTGKFTATQLAERLYANNVLVVGENPITFPNVIGQFSGGADTYLQLNMQNLHSNGSGDIVVTADTGTDTTHYVDFGINGSDYVYEETQPYRPLDGYMIVAGGDVSADPGGNLMIGSITQNKKIDFVVGGLEDANVLVTISETGLKLHNHPITFTDSTTQNTAAAPSNYTQSAFDKANAANNLATSGYSQANAANNLATSAYAKANSALANTSGIFDGNLTISGNVIVSGQTSSTGPITTGNLIVNGNSTLTGNVTMNAATYMTGAVTVNSTMVIANSNFSATDAALTITASGTTVTPANDGYMIHISGKNGVPARVVTDSYGAGSYSLYAGRAARGTVTSPTALQSGDVIARFSSNGYGTTKYQTLGVGRIDFVAAENYTDANTGSQIQFYNCSVGSNTLTNILTLNGDSATFTGVVNPQKGFVYTANIEHSTVTTIPLDFKRDSLRKFTVNDNATVTLSNFVHGKVVEVWINNTAAQNKTITHGCFANSSTVHSTSFTILSQSCAFLRYFSIDGDLANTFVSITYQ